MDGWVDGWVGWWMDARMHTDELFGLLFGYLVGCLVDHSQLQLQQRNASYPLRARAQALLVEAKADYHKPSKSFATPVYVAAQSGYLDCVEQLVSAGAGMCFFVSSMRMCVFLNLKVLVLFFSQVSVRCP